MSVFDPMLRQEAPTLHQMHLDAARAPARLAAELQASTLAAIAPTLALPSKPPSRTSSVTALPVVVAHGMGDSCFNPGMKSVTKYAGHVLNTTAVCVPTADSWVRDTIDGFLLSMDASVEEFARRVRADKRLQNGFDAFGLSQGNNVIRGYIAKYNAPAVRNFLSICGINAGVAAFPHCSPDALLIGGACKALTELLGKAAYNPVVQKALFQADYFRDPTHRKDPAYLRYSQIARWNGEAGGDMSTEKANWAKTQRFVWVMGTKDTMVWPREATQWADVSESYPHNTSIVPYKQTRWFKEDLFGLRSAEEAGKNFFEQYVGDHIRFSDSDLEGWLLKYFVN